MDKIIEKYIKGFNHGFLLNRYQSQLMESLMNSTSNNDYINGLKDGARMYEKQKTTSRTQQIQNLKMRRDKDQDLERY